jgi:hypothetical protein
MSARATDVASDGAAKHRGLVSEALRYRSLVLLAAGWGSVILALLAWGLFDVVAARSRARNAAIDHAADFRSPATTMDAVPAQLTPRSNLETLSSVPFHRNLIVQRRVIEYAVTYPEMSDAGGAAATPVQRLVPGDELETNIGQLIDSSGTRELDNRWISAVATVEQPNRALLTVRFDRRNGRLGGPGSYMGTVSIVDPRVSRVDQQFTVQLAYPWWQFVAALLLAMLVVATVYLWLLRGSFGSRELTLDDLQLWLFSRNAMLSIGTGVAAAVSVWTATYFSNPSWGASFPAATALFGASFSAFVAASTAVTAAGAERYRPDADPGRPPPSRS